MTTKQIESMNRASLVNLGVKLELRGHKNMFTKPYKKKDDLKQMIINEIKRRKKLNKSKSLNNTNLARIQENEERNIRRSKSFTSFKKRSLKKNYTSVNDISQIYDIDRCIYPKVSKLVAIGDIHGDLSVAIKSLKLAGVIDNSIPDQTRDVNKINWTGGDTYVVQLGDQIDRVRPAKLYNNLCGENDDDLICDEGSDLKIISLFEKLHKQAKQRGGALFQPLY